MVLVLISLLRFIIIDYYYFKFFLTLLRARIEARMKNAMKDFKCPRLKPTVCVLRAHNKFKVDTELIKFGKDDNAIVCLLIYESQLFLLLCFYFYSFFLFL